MVVDPEVLRVGTFDRSLEGEAAMIGRDRIG
jgi:hypothetical protein